MSIIAAYTQVSGGWVPEYRYNGIGGVVFREKRMVETRVYQALVSDDHVITSTPANPDNLASPWQVESIDWDAPLGQPLQKTVREVWVNKSAAWEADN
jgi:hypothetical protein